MKVLVVAERLPSRISGGAARQFNLIRKLSRRYDFTVVCPACPVDSSHLQDLIPYVRHIEMVKLTPPPYEDWSRLYWRLNALRHALLDPVPLRAHFPGSSCIRRAVSRLLSEERFDVIQVHQAHLGRSLPHTQTATILDMHDIPSDRERRIMLTKTKVSHRFQAWLEWKKMQALERSIARQFDVCVTVSEHDRASLLRLAPEARVVVVPNGVDTDYFRPQPASREGPNVTFVGSMGYDPNSDGVLWFYRAIFPLIKRRVPNVHFWVVGSNPPSEIVALNDHPNVTITGFVEDVRPYLANSMVVVVPIRLGSGTRLKILDAWAMGKAIVSTELGAEGLEAVHGENILLADEPEPFAECVLNLLSNARQRSCLGKAGRQLVESRYDWSVIALKLDAIYKTLR